VGLLLGLEALRQPLSPVLSALLIREHVSRGSIQPQPGDLARRHVIQAPPGHEECLRHHIGRVIAVSASKRVAQHAVVVGFVKGLETVASRARA
jgi:hypothetical protein